MSQVFSSIREFLVIVSFEKWYSYFITIVASLVAELIWSIISNKTVDSRSIDSLNSIYHAETESRSYAKKCKPFVQWLKDKFKREEFTASSVLIYVLIYIVLILFSIFAYNVSVNGLNFDSFGHQIKAFWDQYAFTMIATPLLIKFVNIIDISSNQGLRRGAVVLLGLLMVFSPFLLSFPERQSAIEPLLLEQFHEMPFPYVTRFYDYYGFWEEARTPFERNGRQSDIDELPDGTTEGLSFDELMENAHTCWNRNEELLKIYTDTAYQKFENGERGTSFHIGLMWYYLGYLYSSSEYYANGGVEFESDDDFSNAAISYREAYKIKEEPQYAKEAMEMYYRVISSDPSTDDIEYAERFVCYLQEHYNDTSIPYLSEICELVPDNMIMQLVRTLRNISAQSVTEDDIDEMNYFLDTDRFEDNAKLLLARAYCQLVCGETFETDEIYDLYTNDSAFFYPEDNINLAWLMYLNNEYGKAYKLAVEAVNKMPSEDDGNVNIEGLLNDAYPLIAEIYLQDDDVASVNTGRLLEKLIDVDTSWYDENSRLRFQIMTLLFAAKSGVRVDMSNVASMSLDLFNGESFDDRLLQATVAFENEDYENCRNTCLEMLEMDPNGRDKHRVQFLYTDTLLKLAEADPEKKDEYLAAAEEEMNSVRDDVEDDYVGCLRRLHTIYNLKGETAQRDEIANYLLQYE